MQSFLVSVMLCEFHYTTNSCNFALSGRNTTERLHLKIESFRYHVPYTLNIQTTCAPNTVCSRHLMKSRLLLASTGPPSMMMKSRAWMSCKDKSKQLRQNPVTTGRHFHYRLQICFQTFLKSRAKPIGELVDYAICRFVGYPMPTQYYESRTNLSLTKTPIRRCAASLTATCVAASQRTMKTLLIWYVRYNDTSTLPPVKRRASTDSTTLTPLACTLVSATLMTSPLQMNTYKVLSNNQVAETINIWEGCPCAHHGMQWSCQGKCLDQHLQSRCTTCVACKHVHSVHSGSVCLCQLHCLVHAQEWEVNGGISKASVQGEQCLDLRAQLRRLGSVFLYHREVSAQEAVYRILFLPLKQLSQKIVCVNFDFKKTGWVLLRRTVH